MREKIPGLPSSLFCSDASVCSDVSPPVPVAVGAISLKSLVVCATSAGETVGIASEGVAGGASAGFAPSGLAVSVGGSWGGFGRYGVKASSKCGAYKCPSFSCQWRA